MDGGVTAIVAAPAGFALARVAAPRPTPGVLVVELEASGICRTDVRAARGELALPAGRVLGHEVAGRVVDGDVRRRGQRITVLPVRACGACARCSAGSEPWRCAAPSFRGLDEDGVFADRFTVPEALALPVPETMSARVAAFVEPLAAALAVLDAPLPRGDTAVMGTHRIARLVARVVAAHTGEAPPCLAPDEDVRDRFATVIEASAEHLGPALRALRPGGVLVAKSRPSAPVVVDWSSLVRKELRIVGVHYGAFGQAITWLAEQRIEVEDLFGRGFALAHAAAAFAAAASGEDHKQFFERDAGLGAR